MSLVSPSQSAAGETIDAADINTPINQIAAVVNGNLDDNNISSVSGSKLVDATVTNAKLSTTAGDAGGSSLTWTPTWTNLSVSSSTVTARYQKIGKLVKGRVSVILGGGNIPTGDVDFTLPVTAATYAGGINLTPIGIASLFDTSASRIYKGDVTISSTTKAVIRAFAADLSFAYTFTLSSTAPMTWANGDEISFQFEYEAA